MCRILPSDCSAASSPIWSCNGDLRVDPVQLQQVDALDAEVAQVQLDLLAQELGAPDGHPLPRTLPGEADLGGDDEVVRVRVQRLADQRVGDVRAVGVGGVDERDAQFDGAPQHADRLRRIVRVAPDTLAGELHRAVAEPVHRQVAAEREGARGTGEGLAGRCHEALLISSPRRGRT